MIERPKAQGLYNPDYEHDACGIGFVVNMQGKKSHQIVKQALMVLDNLTHRGASGCEPNTGDGAGILIQIPHSFFKKIEPQLGFTLPKEGDYGVGMVFLTKEAGRRDLAEQLIEKVIREEKQELLGWRPVPTDDSSLGNTAKACAPFILQVFIKKGKKIKSTQDFERKLFLIRKKIENGINESTDMGRENFFIPSLSSKTIVYKGMLLSEQVYKYFPELLDKDVESALALVHSRFSTNTFPSWDRAHPNRYVIHNGEINTVRGNYNWMHARETQIQSKVFGPDVSKVFPILNPNGSDSAIFDNCLEFLVMGGRSLAHSLMMMIPEPWFYHNDMDDARKAFYEYHSCIMEPWDGPASIAATDGDRVVAVLDRNGLRPSRYWVTKDDLVIMASEVGVLEIPPENVVKKGRLEPGRMFMVDTIKKKIVSDSELKDELVKQHPYREWLNKNLMNLKDLTAETEATSTSGKELFSLQQAFGYTTEEIQKILSDMGIAGKDPIGSMGNDTPLAVLSSQPQLLYSYFKQLFAQVTNPPLDAIREELVTATDSLLGSQGNLLSSDETNCKQLRLDSPMLSNQDLQKIRELNTESLKTATLPIHFPFDNGAEGLEAALDSLFEKADAAIAEGKTILILSDRGISREKAAIPSLLAVSGLHHHLIRNGQRTRVGIVIETAEAREVHHFALLLGYGAGGINPYLALDTLKSLADKNELNGLNYKAAEKNFFKAANTGIIKVLSKMGISTIASYRGAQIFEAIGLDQNLIQKYFTWTATRIEGVGLEVIANEALLRHQAAFDERGNSKTLGVGGKLNWRKNGELHLFNPKTIHALQKSTAVGDYDLYKEFADAVNNQSKQLYTLRGLLEFKTNMDPIPIEEVESVESICQRFKTGAMSYGSISAEAHESLAIAMNRVGGKSNTGEGGEDPRRFTPDENGDLRRSAIKQVASGRFGVTSHYLVNADEIQIKMAQGAKPGEGGQLPGKKVYPWIAKVRGSTAGVELISPPPHHDIYSIEDLAELIHDLKNANNKARINVKLVSEMGVGTIAAGVAKGHADVVLISGYDGGTGASPITSIYHAGLPWELGLAETHQTLVMNDLRSRIVVETDGQLKTGRDVAVAALLGAEEFGFATAPLVVLGCIMMRKCHLGTCPVGVATQNPELREKFTGDPAHVVNYMHFVAQELREIMASLGFRNLNEMIGRVDKLETRKAIKHWKAKGLDFSKILHKPVVPSTVGQYHQMDQDHGLEDSLDMTEILDACRPAIEKGEKVEANFLIKNTNRVVGTITGSEISRKYGAEGLPAGTIKLHFKGSAGQSFGAFVPSGMTMYLEGDANDYVGKGLSGGKIIVSPPNVAPYLAEENIIIGNVALYGATAGEAYFSGMAGERFAVRNSGATTVVEGVGDHGCEYMTGGRVVVLGPTGRNFAAGMSGGLAYVYDPQNIFPGRCNTGLVDLYKVEEDKEISELKGYISTHAEITRSALAKRILDRWEDNIKHFVKVYPRDYKRVVEATEMVKAKGLKGDEALLEAFHVSLA